MSLERPMSSTLLACLNVATHAAYCIVSLCVHSGREGSNGSWTLTFEPSSRLGMARRLLPMQLAQLLVEPRSGGNEMRHSRKPQQGQQQIAMRGSNRRASPCQGLRPSSVSRGRP